MIKILKKINPWRKPEPQKQDAVSYFINMRRKERKKFMKSVIHKATQDQLDLIKK